jgi:hypothetical protein
MKRLALFLASVIGVASAAAQDCRAIPDRDLRLACYDKENGTSFPATPAPAPASTPVAASAPASGGASTREGWKQFISEVRLADESTPKGLGSDPASLSFAKRDGEEFSVIKAALIWEKANSIFPNGTYLATYGWGPIASFSVNRNSLSTKKADSRQADAGLRGTLFKFAQLDAKGNNFVYAAADTKVTFGYRENKVDGTQSNLFVADNVLVTDYLLWGLPYQSPFAIQVLPRFGFVREDVRKAKAGVPTGNFNSVYGGIKVEAFPAVLSDRLRFSMTAQRFVDVDVDGANVKRHENYGKVAVDYFFYSPLENPVVKPSIGLERAIGADLLNGAPRFGQTQLMLRLRIN